MSKHSTDPKFSPLVWLVPVPFVLAAFLPLTIDHSPAPKQQQMAAVSSDGESQERAASAPPAQQAPVRLHLGR
jgi:hypothetical protein